MPRYRIASPFLARLAGVRFEALEDLGTPQVSRAAREVLTLEQDLARLRPSAWAFLREHERHLGREEIHVWRKALRHSEIPERPPPKQLGAFVAALERLQSARSQMDGELEGAVTESRRNLFETSALVLPPYLVFAGDEVHHLTDAPLALGAPALRNSQARKRERHLLLYLQRLAAKNDTFSEFGPVAWLRATPDGATLRFEAVCGILRRDVFWERWVAHALAAAIKADAEAFSEFKPRLNPNGAFVGTEFVLSESSETMTLTPEQGMVLAQCDGNTRVRDFSACCGSPHLTLLPRGEEDQPLCPPGSASGNSALSTIRNFVSKKILVAEMEVPAMEPFAFQVLHRDIEDWADGPARQRWLPIVTAMSEIPRRFAAAVDAREREHILADARQQLAGFGAQRDSAGRALYAAVNPIAEECSRECAFEISEKLLDEVVTEAEPWIDFWRDSYAFIAARVAANLRSLLQKAPAKSGAIPLPAFLRFCEAAKIPLTGPGLVGMAHIAFQEVKALLRERLRLHAARAEYELTVEDCAVVRNTLDYPKFDEFTYPSADLQLAAESVEAVNRGEYRWIIGELHPAAAALHHCMYWSCPDKPAFSRALQSMIHDKPIPHFGFFAADFTAHTTVRVFDALPEHAVFLSPQRANPNWRYVAPAEVEVFIDNDGDVALRRKSGEYLGSFARNWVIPLGFHPFLFTIAPHTPRLRCGKVIVQRRAWSVSAEELGDGNFSGLSRDLVIAVERLRATKDWPRFIYIRPSEQALRRSGAENRDKDTKPVFIDLESYLFLEIFHRWLTKAGELEVTEMLPAPDELLWREADGRRTFELRTLICPRAENS